MLFTLFVLPVNKGKNVFKWTEFSRNWPSLQNIVLCDDADRLVSYTVETPFFGYCYQDEKPDIALFNALNFHYKVLGWDFLVLYRKQAVGLDFKYYRSPRIYRKGVQLNGLLPSSEHRYENLHVLQGYLIDV